MYPHTDTVPQSFVEDLLEDPGFVTELAGLRPDEWAGRVRVCYRAYRHLQRLRAMCHTQVLAALDGDDLGHLRGTPEEAEIVRHEMCGDTILTLEDLYGPRWASSPGYMAPRHREHVAKREADDDPAHDLHLIYTRLIGYLRLAAAVADFSVHDALQAAGLCVIRAWGPCDSASYWHYQIALPDDAADDGIGLVIGVADDLDDWVSALLSRPANVHSGGASRN